MGRDANCLPRAALFPRTRFLILVLLAANLFFGLPATYAADLQQVANAICKAGGYITPEEHEGRVEYAVRLEKHSPDSLVELICQSPKITSLRISEGELSDAACAMLGRAPQLRTLILGYTDISDAGLRLVMGAPNLKSVELYGIDDLGDADLPEFACLPRLQKLGLQSDSTTAAALEHLKGSPDLNHLNISNKTIAADQWHVVAKLPQVHSLIVGGSAVTEEALRNIGQLQQLKRLSITPADSVSGNGLDHLSQLTQCQEIIIQARNVDQECFEAFSRLKPLRELHFSFSSARLTGDNLARLKDLPDLQSLNFVMCALTNDAYAACCQLKQLRTLTIGFCKPIPEGPLKDLANLRSLEKLEICYTQIGDDTCAAIAQLAELKQLSLAGSVITPQGLEQLVTLKRLQELNMVAPGLNTTHAAALRQLPSLKKLSIATNEGSADELALLARLPLLRDLALVDSFNNQLFRRYAFDPAPLISSQSLQTLTMQGYKLDEAQCAQLLRIPNLRHLYLLECDISAAGERLLEAGRPGALICNHVDSGDLNVDAQHEINADF